MSERLAGLMWPSAPVESETGAMFMSWARVCRFCEVCPLVLALEECKGIGYLR
jgi:hypothetical protein